jgi:hypothetical protein
MGEQLKVWSFVVTVIDEDYDWAEKRLRERLGVDQPYGDYDVYPWPGEI